MSRSNSIDTISRATHFAHRSSRQVWLANPTFIRWRLMIVSTEVFLGIFLATAVAVLEPKTSSMIFMACLPFFFACGVYMVWVDSRYQQRNNVRIKNDIAYVLIMAYYASAFIYR